MKKLLLLTVFICLIAGCNLLQYATTDVYGWNLSSCFSDFDSMGTCYNLYVDNKDKLTVPSE